MKIEITKDLIVNSKQQNLIDIHSILNVLNILTNELTLLSLELKNNPQKLDNIIEELYEYANTLYNNRDVYEKLEQINELLSEIKDCVNNCIESNTDLSDKIYVKNIIDNLISIIKIMEVRVFEILTRKDETLKWEERNITDIIQNLKLFLKAIEKNSKGKYGIVFDAGLQKETDYFIDININGFASDKIFIPSILQDLMRDLLANARKYTVPGGIIFIKLIENSKELKLVIKDNGRGIPEEQIESVVDYGFRATNVKQYETMGAGLGLTKAYWFTKQLNGKMWIDSEINSGTEISIVIPRIMKEPN